MEAIILGAGRGSRMGEYTRSQPKLFLEVDSTPLYRHQIRAIEPFCERVHIVLGYGFEKCNDPKSEFNTDNLNIDVVFHIVPDWKDKENAYTCNMGLKHVGAKDTLILCGDVIFRHNAVEHVVRTYESSLQPNGFNGVAAIEGIQNEMTAVRWDDERTIIDYGAIEGHQEAGLFILNQCNWNDARLVLESHSKEWFPVIFEKTPSKPVLVDRSQRREINTPSQLEDAREKYSIWKRSNMVSNY